MLAQVISGLKHLALGALPRQQHSALRFSTLIKCQPPRASCGQLTAMNGAIAPFVATQQHLRQPQSLQQACAAAVQMTQKRYAWGYRGRMMLKDLKRREMTRRLTPTRIRLQALRANSILPAALKRVATEELHQFPLDSSLAYVGNRCQLTSKAGGCLHRWRLSRIMWRLQVDYNEMSGATRATWGRPTRNAVMFTFKKTSRNWFNYDGYRQLTTIDKQAQRREYRFKLY